MDRPSSDRDGRQDRPLSGNEAAAAELRAKPVLAPGRNCWRIEEAERVGLLVDAEDYFATVATALEAAQRRVMLLGWDFHSRVALRRDGKPGDLPVELAPLLDALVRRRRDLDIYVLEWDFAMLYWAERESKPQLRFGERTHRRLHFRLDAEHPLGASHHQKIVVIDDALAFVGGLDLTSNRWDQRSHAVSSPLRRTPDGEPYAPFHDIQMAVDGPAAAALAELARERWRRATGKRLAPVRGSFDPWPRELEPQLEKLEVGIARTDPGDEERGAVREVETLYRDAIASAERWIYIENQYLSAGEVAECLEARLREPEGPEIVIVGPRCCSGWLEERCMGALRDRFLSQLREADRFGRLRVYYPRLPGDEEPVNVHAKLMIVDDRILRVGSANLSNRSMGLDSECDLAVEARRLEHVEAIARFRNDLLAEHLGSRIERVAEAMARKGSLIAAIEELRRGERRLEPLEESSGELTRELAERFRVFDPEQPLSFNELLPQLGASETQAPARRPGSRALGLLAFCVAAAAAWRFTPIAEFAQPEALAALAETIRGHSLAAPLATAFVALAATAFVPVTALIVASGLVFPPAVAVGVSLGGAILGAALGHLLGRGLWRDALRRLAGPRLQRLSRRLERRGILATATVRLLPIAPFGLVNLVAGATHVKLRDFLLGTLIAMAPGVALLVIASDRILEALERPDGASLLPALLAVGALAALLLVSRRVARASDHRGR